MNTQMKMNSPVYFDYNATTPLLPEVFRAMEPYFVEQFGNASSLNHPYGWSAKMAVDKARKQVALSIGCQPKEIYFTSGATESNNMAILGVAMKGSGSPPHLITSNIEHKAILEVCEIACQRFGAQVTIVKADPFGQISLASVQKAVRPNTRLVSIMMANNEIGTINPIGEIGPWVKSQGILFHSDCAQSFGKVPIDVDQMGIDLLSISGHKIYGPKGVGVLYIRSKNPTVELLPVFGGGAQEGGIRPGTLNVPAIVGLGAACELALSDMTEESRRLKNLQTRLIQGILEPLSEVVCLNGHPTDRLVNNVNFSLRGLSSDMFALGLSGLALSSGSACTSGSPHPSHVLKALGHSDELARASLRFGLGRGTTEADIDLAIEKVVAMVQKNREISIN